MTERERLVELIRQAEFAYLDFSKMHPCEKSLKDFTADYLIANGVIVPTHKPIGVVPNRDKFISDVCCPYCDALLSGYYGDDPPKIITCYKCGEYLDCTKLITN